MHDGNVMFQSRKCRGIFHIIAKPVHPWSISAHTAVAGPARDIIHGSHKSGSDVIEMKLWHERLGHAYFGSIKKLITSGAVEGASPNDKPSGNQTCDSCMKGKQSRKTLHTNNSRSKERCAVIHSDVCGPMSVPSFSGCRYYVSFIDEYSGFIVIVPIARKSEVLSQFKIFLAWIERKFSCSVKRLHSDHGGEYVGQGFRDYLANKGIEQSHSPPYAPNLNGISERTNRTIVECARSILQHASLPRTFWAEAVVHAARIRNMFFSPRQVNFTSYELMMGKRPNIGYLRVFGCLGWHHIPKQLRTKLDAKSEAGIIIACLENSQYKLWIPSRNVAVISRDVTIVENVFPAAENRTLAADLGSGLILMEEDDESPTPNNQSQPLLPIPSKGKFPCRPSSESPAPEKSTLEICAPPTDDSPPPLTIEQQELLTHYPRAPSTEENSSTHSEERNRPDEETLGTRYPRRDRKAPEFYSPSSANIGRALVMTHSDTEPPTTVEEALSQPEGDKWKAAIESELNSLKRHETWEVVDHREGVKLLPTRFVFVRKYDENGLVLRHKARLVVRGYLQGDVEQTFAPVVDFTTVRTCLTVAVQRKYFIHQMDVRTAFLHGKIDTDVYIRAPDGLTLCNDGQMLKLQRGLYGLKQAPRLWQEKWMSVMNKMGFRPLLSDPCVYRRDNILLLLYVDDIIVMGPVASEIESVKEQLKSHLDVKDLGTLRSFLGVMFSRKSSEAWLSQSHYISKVLRNFGMSSCKPVTTPMREGSLKELSEIKSKEVDRLRYQELLGCLLFISTRTRPDISASISILCRYAANACEIHWIALKRVLIYLQGTITYALRISAVDDQTLVAYCDADWAGDRSDRKSTTGVLLRLGSSSLTWKSMKQTSVALSTTEAEFIAMAEATKLVIWLRRLLKEIDCEQVQSTSILEDNQGAIVWGQEGVRHAKHVSIKKNFVKEHVDQGTVQIVYCETTRMVADTLTKPLPRIAFEKHRQDLGVLQIE